MEWTCGHNSNGVCGECYRRLAWKAHQLQMQVDRLLEQVPPQKPCTWPNCICDENKCYYGEEEFMGTKLKPGEFDCYQNAEPDEPMFVLLARDKSAPEIVRVWAYQRKVDILKGLKPEEDMKMVEEAMECAANMEKWRHDNRGPT